MSRPFEWAIEQKVHSWKELIAVLYSEMGPGPGGHLRSGRVYRGLADASWGCQTGIERLGSDPKSIEAPAIRAFTKYAPTGSFRADSFWERLAVAQHNGLPTRLLDWTISPLIAVHFATSERQYAKADAVIWSIDAWQSRQLLPKELQAVLDERNGAWMFDVELLESLFRDLSDFDDRHPDDVLLFFEPPTIDARIENQYAVFSLMNCVSKTHDAFLEQRSSEHPDLVRRIVIDKEAKPEIRSMLDKSNITERMLFPGLPGLCDWLRRYYSPA